jgi:hypothetical protein
MHNALVEACGTPLTRIGLRARDRTSHKRLGKQTTTRHGSSCSQPSSTTSGSPKVQPKGPKAHQAKAQRSQPTRPTRHRAMASSQPHAKKRKRDRPTRPHQAERRRPTPPRARHPPTQANEATKRGRGTRETAEAFSRLQFSSAQYSASAIPQPRKEADAHQRDRTTPPVRRDPAGPEASPPPPPVLPPPRSRRRRTLAPPRVPQGRDRRRWTGVR